MASPRVRAYYSAGEVALRAVVFEIVPSPTPQSGYGGVQRGSFSPTPRATQVVPQGTNFPGRGRIVPASITARSCVCMPNAALPCYGAVPRSRLRLAFGEPHRPDPSAFIAAVHETVETAIVHALGGVIMGHLKKKKKETHNFSLLKRSRLV